MAGEKCPDPLGLPAGIWAWLFVEGTLSLLVSKEDIEKKHNTDENIEKDTTETTSLEGPLKQDTPATLFPPVAAFLRTSPWNPPKARPSTSAHRADRSRWTWPWENSMCPLWLQLEGIPNGWPFRPFKVGPRTHPDPPPSPHKCGFLLASLYNRQAQGTLKK